MFVHKFRLNYSIDGKSWMPCKNDHGNIVSIPNILSSIQAYIHHTHHNISPNDFSISSCHSFSNIKLLIRKSLLISKFKPSLNGNISSKVQITLYSNNFLHCVTWHFSLVTLLVCRFIMKYCRLVEPANLTYFYHDRYSSINWLSGNLHSYFYHFSHI